MKRYICSFVLALSALSSVLLGASCGSRTAEPAISDGGLTTVDVKDAGPVEAVCTLSGDKCIGDPNCCPATGAYRYDIQRQCYEKNLTPLRCNPTPIAPGSTKACSASPDSTLCLVRPAPGGADGGDAGLEYFVSRQGRFEDLYADCEPAINNPAVSAPPCP